jgi:hypothetical protein
MTKVGNPQGNPVVPPDCILEGGGATGAAAYATKVANSIAYQTNCQSSSEYVYIGGEQLQHQLLIDNDPTDPSTSVEPFKWKQGDAYRRVHVSYANCMDKVDPNATGLQNWIDVRDNWFKANAQAVNGYLQCVGFAEGVLQGTFKKPLIPEKNAQEFANNPQAYAADYDWIPNNGPWKQGDSASVTNMKAGDVVIFRGLTYGHIAIVTKVADVVGSGGSLRFRVAGANELGTGEVAQQWYNTGTGLLTVAGWFRKK